jgi:hypothetical protein
MVVPPNHNEITCRCGKAHCDQCGITEMPEMNEDQRRDYIRLCERAAQNNMIYDHNNYGYNDIEGMLDVLDQLTNLDLNSVPSDVISNAIENKIYNFEDLYGPNKNYLVAEVDIENIDPNQNQNDGIHVPPHVALRFDRQHIQVIPHMCIVCRNPTDNHIGDACENGCAYYCHDECAARWIITRFDNPHPYCMICGSNHAVNQLPYVMSDNAFIHVASDMVEHGQLDLNQLGPQIIAYMNFRGVNVQDLAGGGQVVDNANM